MGLALMAANGDDGSASGKLEERVSTTLDQFYEKVPDGRERVQNAKAVLVFPRYQTLNLVFFSLPIETKGRLFRPNGEELDALEADGTYSIRSRFFNRAIKAGIGSNAFVYLINDDDLISRLDAGEKWKPKEDFKMGVLTPIGEIDLPTMVGAQGTSVAVLGNRGLMVGLGFSGVTIKKAKGG